MANRMRHQITDYERILRDYHKASFRHVVVFEAEISEDDKRHLFCQADLLRQCGNEIAWDHETASGTIATDEKIPRAEKILW